MRLIALFSFFPLLPVFRCSQRGRSLWRGWLWAVALGLGLGLAWAGAAAAQASQPPQEQATRMQDDLGRPLRGAVPPQRVVSLLPSLTESVCALGACQRLVGVDRYSSWPEQVVATLPVVGGGLDPNIEAIVALRPDVVLLSRGTAARSRLEALGLRTVVLDADTYEQFVRVLGRLEVLLGLEAGQPARAVEQRIQLAMEQVAQSLPPTVRGQRVYFGVGRGGYAAGRASFIGYLLERLGLENVVPAELGAFPHISPEFVLHAAPEVLMYSSHSQVQSMPGWASLPAVQQQRLCSLEAEHLDILVRPGPRMDEAARLLGACLRRVYRPGEGP